MGRDVLGEFEHQVLLAILRLEGEAYSVPIVVELEQRTGKDVAPAAVYIALRRLEQRGLLASRLEQPSEKQGGRSRRYFKLRPQALHKLRESHRVLASLWEGMEEVLEEKS